MMVNANIEKAGILGTGLKGLGCAACSGSLPQGRPLGYQGVFLGVKTPDVVVAAPLVPASQSRQVPPAALLKPMPTIIPAKPGQVTSGETGLACQLSAFANDNPILGVMFALGIGWLIRGMR